MAEIVKSQKKVHNVIIVAKNSNHI